MSIVLTLFVASLLLLICGFVLLISGIYLYREGFKPDRTGAIIAIILGIIGISVGSYFLYIVST